MAKATAVKETNLPATTPPPTNGAVSTSTRKPLGAGYEEADAESFAIPFLIILQPLSPQITELDGAKPGMFMDSVTNELYDTVEVIPCYFQRRFNRWAPRETGGGFKGQFTVAQADELRKNKDVVELENRLWYPLPDGTVNEKRCDRLADTRNHFVLVRTREGNLNKALISLASSQIKKSKGWLTKMQLKGGDAFDYKYVLATTLETNEKGKWYSLTVGAPAETSEDERVEALEFYSSVVAGKVEVKHDQQSENTE